MLVDGVAHIDGEIDGDRRSLHHEIQPDHAAVFDRGCGGWRLGAAISVDVGIGQRCDRRAEHSDADSLLRRPGERVLAAGPVGQCVHQFRKDVMDEDLLGPILPTSVDVDGRGTGVVRSDYGHVVLEQYVVEPQSTSLSATEPLRVEKGVFGCAPRGSAQKDYALAPPTSAGSLDPP